MKSNFLERLLAGTVHLVAMGGVLHMVCNLVGFPVFPRATLYWLIPHLVVLAVSVKWSKYVFAHVVGAMTFHMAALSISLVPAFFRVLSAAGVLGERWTWTGWGGFGFTPTWAWMVFLITPITIFTFGLTGDGAVKGYTGELFDYPLIGRYTSRLSR